MGFYKDKKEQINTFPETVRELETFFKKFKKGGEDQKSRLFSNLNGRVVSFRTFMSDFSNYLDEIQGEISSYSGPTSEPSSSNAPATKYIYEIIINELTQGVFKKKKYFEVNVNNFSAQEKGTKIFKFDTLEEVFSSLVNGDESYLIKHYYSPDVRNGDFIEFRFFFLFGGVLKSLGSTKLYETTRILSSQITKQPGKITISYNTHMGRTVKGLSSFSVVMVK